MKAEHLEKQVTRLEEERDNWEKKYEVRFCPSYEVDWIGPFVACRYSSDPILSKQEMSEKYKASKAELEQLVGDMEGL